MKTSKEMADLVFRIRDDHVKNRKKINRKRFFRFASVAAATVCGCITMCFGGYAVWNYVVKPIVVEEKQPEQPAATQKAIATQMTKPTETAVTAVTTIFAKQTAAETATEITTETTTGTAAEAEASTMVTVMTELNEEEIYTEITTEVTTTTVPVTEVREELYTEPAVTTRKPMDIKLSQGYINYMNIHLTQKKIAEYIDCYEIDAGCYVKSTSSGAEKDHVEVLYINERGREDVEWFIEENNIDMSNIEIKEMDLDLKTYIINQRVGLFMGRNELSCCYNSGIIKRHDGDNTVIVEPDVYEFENEEDLKTLEEYITYHGYDKIIPYVLKLKDPDEDTTEETDTDEGSAQEEAEEQTA